MNLSDVIPIQYTERPQDEEKGNVHAGSLEIGSAQNIDDCSALCPIPPANKKWTSLLLESKERKRAPVIVGFSIYSINDINAAAQTFFIDMKITIKWKANEFVNDLDMVALRTTSKFHNGDGPFEKNDEGKFPDYVVKRLSKDDIPMNKPTIEFGNCLESGVYEGKQKFFLSPNEEPGYIIWEQQYSGVFTEKLELHDFPWDFQKLHIDIRMPALYDRFRPFKNDLAKNDLNRFLTHSEWKFHKPGIAIPVPPTGAPAEKGFYQIMIPATRKSSFYTYNVMMIMSGICAISFTAFAMPTEDLADRLSVVLTVLLTAVAFKLVIADSLPKIAYWTGLDKYLNFNLLLLLFIAMENAMVTLIFDYHSKKLSLIVDRVTLLVFVVIYITFHLWFLFLVKAMQKRTQVQLKNAMGKSDIVSIKVNEEIQPIHV